MSIDRDIESYLHSLREARSEPLCAYVYDLQALRRHVTQLVSLLPAQCRLYYAAKANSEAAILQTLAPLVHGFEVASLGEASKVQAAARGSRMVFGGPGKTDTELEQSLQLPIELLHVESRHELLRLEHISGRLGRQAPVLLRVNLRDSLPSATLQMAGAATQFGIDEAELPEIIELAQACPHIDLQGFHFHSISNQLDAERHIGLVEVYLERARRWTAELGLQTRFINAGGGIGVNYADLGRQFAWPQFARRLAQVLERRLPPGCTLLFECGRYLSAACGFYAVEVLDIKRNHGKTFAVVRGGTHHFRLPQSWQHSHPFSVVPLERWPYSFARPEVRDCPITVVGQLCTPKDVLARDIFVPQLRAGDVVLFRYTGAYGWAISHHDFLSHAHPEHIFLDGDPAREGQALVAGLPVSASGGRT